MGSYTEPFPSSDWDLLRDSEEINDLKERLPMVIEIEAKFDVSQQASDSVFGDLSSRESLGEYRFGACDSRIQIDLYYDTSALALSRNNAVLRARIIQDKPIVIALKLQSSDHSSQQTGLHARNESEEPPSSDHLNMIRNALAGFIQVGQPVTSDEIHRFGYEGLFRSWGLSLIYSARTTRISRNIRHSSDGDVGTLVLDEVRLGNDDRTMTFHQLEVESINTSDMHVKEVQARLKSEFGKTLVPAVQSKYQKGLQFLELKADLKLEAKLLLSDDPEAVRAKLASLRRIANFEVGSKQEMQITDEYFDTPDFGLRKHRCYLRLRKKGSSEELTLRVLSEGQTAQLINMSEIKDAASASVASKIASHLAQAGVIERDDALRSLNRTEAREALLAAGLRPVVHTNIHRLLFPLIHSKHQFGNIKFDTVEFSNHDRRSRHTEVEIAVERSEELPKLDAVAEHLCRTFQAKRWGRPKYFIGLELLGLVSSADVPMGGHTTHIVERVRLPEPNLDVLVRTLVANAGIRETLRERARAGSGLADLKNSISRAIEDTRLERKLQIAMLIALFIVGSVFVAIGISGLFHGGTAYSQLASLSSCAFGGLLEATLFFPIKRLDKIARRSVSLRVASDYLGVVLDVFREDPTVTEKYVGLIYEQLRESHQ